MAASSGRVYLFLGEYGISQPPLYLIVVVGAAQGLQHQGKAGNVQACLSASESFPRDLYSASEEPSN